MSTVNAKLEVNKVYQGDCLEVMRTFPDNCISSIICDPPYGLGNDPDIADLLRHWLNDKDYDTGPGFMQRAWDIVPGPAIWRECYRVLKPGGCLMAFGGTRTVDLLSIAIRLAGFQKFDEICWIHGQGFSKGADVSKKLDAMVGAEREVVGEKHNKGRVKAEGWRMNGNGNHDPITAPATEAAKQFNGYKTQLKPAHEIILCFWKPREKSFAYNALKWGVSGLWIDGCRIATNGEVRERKDTINTPNAEVNFNGCDTKVNVSKEWKLGRYPANVLLSHDPRCVRVGVRRVRGHNGYPNGPGGNSNIYEFNVSGHSADFRESPREGYADLDGYETVEAWECHPDCPICLLDQQAGVRKSGARKGTGNPKYGGSSYHHSSTKDNASCEASTGTASRFFYCPKAPGREKWFYCEICDDCYSYAERDDHAHGKPKGKRKHQIAHPTVKPELIVSHCFSVLEYLCRLTKTPTGGIVLDPFGGSGTTALAAIANGRDFILVENDPIYHKIATKRIAKAKENPRQLKLL